MSDPEAKRSLDLDRVRRDEDGGHESPKATRGTAAGAAPLEPRTFMRFADVDPHGPRRLLNLFPDSALEPERPPASTDRSADPPAPIPWRPAPATSSEISMPARAQAIAASPRPAASDSGEPYRSASFERARREVLAAIRSKRAFALLTAPAGMGKTTLCLALARELDDENMSTSIVDAPRSLDALHSFLESLSHLHISAVVFIDNAHELPPDVLAGLAKALAPGNPGVRLLQFVLAGQPALKAMLSNPGLRDANSNIVLRTELGGLQRFEIGGYLARRVSIAGGRSRFEFGAAAADSVFERSSGVPAAVNRICDRALTLARQAAAPVIDEAMIATAGDDLAPAPVRSQALTAMLIAGSFALLVLGGAGGALWLWRDAVSRTILGWENIPLAPAPPILEVPAPVPPITPPA